MQRMPHLELFWSDLCTQIFIISSEKIQHKGYETLYKYTTRNPKAAVSRYVSSVPLQWQVLPQSLINFSGITIVHPIQVLHWHSRCSHSYFSFPRGFSISFAANAQHIGLWDASCPHHVLHFCLFEEPIFAPGVHSKICNEYLMQVSLEETHSFLKTLQPLAYMSLHIALTTATFAVTKIWWDSYTAHTAFLLVVFCWATWNGEDWA